MPGTQYEVAPYGSWAWDRSSAKDIRALSIGYDEPYLSIMGVATAKGELLTRSGFRLPLKDFEAMCREFLAQLDKERGGDQCPSTG